MLLGGDANAGREVDHTFHQNFDHATEGSAESALPDEQHQQLLLHPCMHSGMNNSTVVKEHASSDAKVLTIRMLQIHPSPDATVQQTPLNVVGLRVPHAQPLVVFHSQSHMLPSLVGDQELLQLLVEAWVCVGQLYQLFELAHCTNADTGWEQFQGMGTKTASKLVWSQDVKT